MPAWRAASFIRGLSTSRLSTSRRTSSSLLLDMQVLPAAQPGAIGGEMLGGLPVCEIDLTRPKSNPLFRLGSQSDRRRARTAGGDELASALSDLGRGGGDIAV